MSAHIEAEIGAVAQPSLRPVGAGGGVKSSAPDRESHLHP